MTKPDCKQSTACGMSCVSRSYNCTSSVNCTKLLAVVKPDLLSIWSESFSKAPLDVLALVDRLDAPVNLSDGSQEYNAYAEGKGISMGSKLDPSVAESQYIFRHEYGHYADRQLLSLKDAEQRAQDFELATGGTTVADIQYLADKRSTSIGKQLDRTADSLGFDKDAMFDLYMAASSNSSANTGYVSSTAAVHDAMRKDEADLLAKHNRTDKDKLAIRQTAGPMLTAEAFSKTVNTLAKENNELPGALVRKALATGQVLDSRFMLAVLSDDPTRLANEADRLLKAGGIVRDLAGSLTGNVVGSGHTDEYYASGLPYSKRNTEAFASIFALHSAGDELATKAAEYFAYRAYEQLKLSVTSTVSV